MATRDTETAAEVAPPITAGAVRVGDYVARTGVAAPDRVASIDSVTKPSGRGYLIRFGWESGDYSLAHPGDAVTVVAGPTTKTRGQ